MPKRVTFYFDGFNFYFALKRKKKISPEWKDFYWLDLVAFCESFLGPDQVLEKVIYFTASPLSPQKNSRQSAFLNANRILHPDKFEVIRGKYMSKQIECPYCKIFDIETWRKKDRCKHLSPYDGWLCSR